jgi:hypothetical protein
MRKSQASANSEQEHSIDQEHGVGLRCLERSGDRCIEAEVKRDSAVTQIAAGTERVNECSAQGWVVEGILEVALGCVGTAPVAVRSRPVEAVNRGPNDRPAAAPDEWCQCITQRCLSSGVDPVDGDPDRVRPVQRNHEVGKPPEDLALGHALSRNAR